MGLIITETTETLESILSKDFISNELQGILSDASILLYPFENLRETSPPPFPIGTEELLRYFKERLPVEYKIDICISDDDYLEFAFNNNYKRLGNFVVKYIAVPVFVTVLAAYINDKYVKQDESKPHIQIIDQSTNDIRTLEEPKYIESTHIKFSVTIVNDSIGSTKNISYEGPAKDINTVLEAFKEYEN